MSDEEPGLLIGEVTPEVRAFLESMGRTVHDIKDNYEHHATHEVGRPKRVSRQVTHDPSAWGPLMAARWPHVIQPSRVESLRVEVLEEFEVGARVSTAFRMQRNYRSYLSSLSSIFHTSRSHESEAA